VTAFRLSAFRQPKGCHTIIEKSSSERALYYVTDEFYVRKLPHWQPADTWVFVTWRLAGSAPRVPATLTRGLSDGQRFALPDAEADRAASGPIWLADPRVAQLVRDKIIHLDGSVYELAAWAIMANHVHIVILPKIPLRKIMQRIKGCTACEANRFLGRTGSFWKDESYDHFIRSNDEFNRIIRYVEWNPVKAGLVEELEHYEWSSAGQTKVCHTRLFVRLPAR
jgi:putative transposase